MSPTPEFLHSNHSIVRRTGGISRGYRRYLEILHRRDQGPFNSNEAAEALGLDVSVTRRLLSHLASQGWLVRLRRGLYSPVPLEARKSGEWQEDPWVSASKAFSPCYVGGWSACEHWHFTDQVFRDLMVVTARHVRKRLVDLQGERIRLKVLPASKLFGTANVWRGRVRVRVSDPSRTIVDVLEDPAIGGGIRHVANVLQEYFQSEHRDDQKLIDYAGRRGNRSVFKRLGYLAETLGLKAAPLIATCHDRQSKGITALDPSVRRPGRIVRRWNLRINVDMTQGIEAQ